MGEKKKEIPTGKKRTGGRLTSPDSDTWKIIAISKSGTPARNRCRVKRAPSNDLKKAAAEREDSDGKDWGAA